jgi:hypothetical protein
MHTSQDCNIYMHCSSRPIIEKCNHIQFAPLPTPFDTQLLLVSMICMENVGHAKSLLFRVPH